MRSFKKGFTLAEVLITLAIIGVVAAMTIPSLIQNTNKQELVTALQKEYATFSQAYNLVLLENGGDITSIITGITNTDDVNFLNAFSTKFKMIKNCGSEMGCWYASSQKGLNGTQVNTNIDQGFNTMYAKAILADGAMILIDISNATCSGTAGTTNLGVCGNLVVDINGAKGPNTVGRDYFNFWITKTGIYPFGIDNDGKICDPAAEADLTNRGCAARVIKEGGMHY